MKLPLSWLRDWVSVDADADRIASCLTMRGFYVAGIEVLGGEYPGVVVARVLEVTRHPNADRLSLCRVDGGAGELRVVCGAPNVHAGMIVALATVGATLSDGTTIRKSKIRGEESQGMLCSARELGLSGEHEGILDLGSWASGGALALGRPLVEVLGAPDQVLEVEVPFNRPDGLGVIGLAREIRAGLGGRWTEAARARLAARWSGRSDFDLELEDREGCPRYLAQIVEQVVVGPSPSAITRRLAAMGQRSVNNVVDATNLVLLEYGQPLHAFDLKKLQGPAIRVRRAREGEKLTTLDGKERALGPEILVIADKSRPVALAGVMGGADSEVTGETTSILLECAWFDPRRVRRGSSELGLSTEASRRYERGVDPEIGSAAAARFLSLLREMSSDIRMGAARARDHAPAQARTLRLRTSRCVRLLGLPVNADEAGRQLEAMDFGVERGDPMAVRVPSWRPDVTLEDDLVEEIGRSFGYDRIPEASPDSRGVFAVRGAREQLASRARRAMLARGITEAWTTTLISHEEAAATGGLLGESAEPVRLANPMSREGEVLRPNLIAGLLRACAHNLRQGTESVRLFEIGSGFQREEPRPGVLPREVWMLCAIATGARYAHAHDAAQSPMDFSDAKGLWEAWLEEMSVDTPTWRTYSSTGWKPGASAEVATATSRVGWAGTLGQELLRAWQIEVPVHAFAVLLDPLATSVRTTAGASLPARFPPVRRDVAFFVPESVTHGQMEAALREVAGSWLVAVELFDVYAGPGTPPGMKSLAYALRFQHPERTLTESEVAQVQDKMAASLANTHGARLRER
jgi:phenylalanyl-tRNA synthetase beta chain